MLVYYTIIYMFDELALLEALTKKRVEIMREIMNGHPSSIRELAESLERDIKNVWDDLHVLQEHDLISFRNIGRTKRPVIKRQVIVTTIKMVDEYDE